MSKEISKFGRHTLVYYQMICNAFREPEDYEQALEKLEIKEVKLGEELVDMVSAMRMFCDRASKGNIVTDDLLDFSYILNRAVVESALRADGDEVGDE